MKASTEVHIFLLQTDNKYLDGIVIIPTNDKYYLMTQCSKLGPVGPSCYHNNFFIFQIKGVSWSQVFESADMIFNGVTDEIQGPEQPEGAHSSHETLLRICNRTRKSLRPKRSGQLRIRGAYKLDIVTIITSGFKVAV